MSGERLAVVTNLPAPYRMHQFRALSRELEARGDSLDVHFMAGSAPYRHWRYDPASAGFESSVGWGVHPGRGFTYFHFNPGIVASMLASPPTWLLLGGTWWVPTTMALATSFSMLRRHVPLIFSAEANWRGSRHQRGPAAIVRRLALGRFDAFAVAGERAAETLHRWGVPEERPMLPLPNVVDEAVFRDSVDDARQAGRDELRSRLGLSPGDLVVLWPGRLQESTKGILNFLRATALETPSNVRLLVTGDGPDEDEVKAWVEQNGNGRVRLLGWQTQDQMVELLAAADACILPSLSDSNPLSMIEALWAGLPILISDRCGNAPEVVEAGSNGWTVDPGSQDSMRAAWADLTSRSAEALAGWGLASRTRAAERFDTPLVVKRFMDNLYALGTRPGL